MNDAEDIVPHGCLWHSFSLVAVELRTWISREGHTDQFTTSIKLVRTQALSVRRIEEDDLRQPSSQIIKRAHE